MIIEERVKKIIAKTIDVELDKIHEDTAIGDFPDWDSLGQLRIITALEKEFNISFDPEDIMEFEDVGDLVGAIEEHTKP